MRIAIVINTAWNIYNFRRGLIEALIQDGHEVWAIAPRDSYVEALEHLGCHYAEINLNNKGTNPFQDLRSTVQLSKVFAQVKPDVVLLYTIKPNLYGSLAAKWCGIPAICNVSGLGTAFLHHGVTAKVARVLYKIAFKYPYKIFFQNPDDQELFISKGLVKPERCSLLPGSGVDLKRFDVEPFKVRSPFTFLMVARLLFDKGIVEYLEAGKALKTAGHQVRIQVAGTIDESGGLGLSAEALQPYLETGLVEHLPFTDQIELYYKQADVVVLPSYREGTPRSLLEAAAMGKPLIATDVPGCREVVEPDYNGWLCAVKSSEELKNAMQKALQCSEERLKKIGMNSRSKVEKEFNQEVVINAYLSALNELKLK